MRYTCHRYSITQGSHPWSVCPAKRRTCTRCGGNDHFSPVCLESTTTSRSVKGMLPRLEIVLKGEGEISSGIKINADPYTHLRTQANSNSVYYPRNNIKMVNIMSSKPECYIDDCLINAAPIYITYETLKRKKRRRPLFCYITYICTQGRISVFIVTGISILRPPPCRLLSKTAYVHLPPFQLCNTFLLLHRSFRRILTIPTRY